MSVKARPDAAVLVAGVPLPTPDSITVRSGSAVDLHLPPVPGSITGSRATVEVGPPTDHTARPQVPWSPLYRAHPGQPVEIRIGGATLLRGVIEASSTRLTGSGLELDITDPLGHVDRDFSAPGLVSTMGSWVGQTERRRPGLSILHYVDAALKELGAHASVPQGEYAEWHQSMTGTAYPSRGILERATQWTGTAAAGSPNWPAQRIPDAPLGDGRVGMVDPYVIGYTEEANRWAKFHLFHDLYPSAAQDYWVRVSGPDSDTDGFGLSVLGTTVRLVAWPASGSSSVLASWTITPARRRVLVEYDPGTHRLAVRFSDEAAPVVTGVNPGMAFPSLAAATQVRVVVRGTGTVPAVSLQRRAAHIDILSGTPVRTLDTPQGASFDLDQNKMDRRHITDHPPVMRQPAVSWLVDTAAKDVAVLFTDDLGVVHWADPRSFEDLPVSHTITDDGSGIDLDDLALQQATRRPYRLVRVVGKRGPVERMGGPGPEPNVLLARADQEVVLRPGDSPVEMFLGPHQDGMSWIGGPEEIDLSLRYAGEPPTESWHKPDDFARGRGSWGGGYVRDSDSDASGNETGVRWATPGDVTMSAEWVDFDTIKVTMEPGPSLPAGTEFVNLPAPSSVGLREQNPRRFSEYLPRIRGWQRRMAPVDVVGESTVMPARDDAPIYIHEAGDAIALPTYAADLAQDMADRYLSHYGQVTVEADLDVSVKVGQRVHIRPSSRSDVTLDAVVTGIPSRRWPECTMTLSCWVMDVVVHSVTWAEQQALTSGTWGEQQTGGTWAQHAAGVLVDAQPTSEVGENVQ